METNAYNDGVCRYLVVFLGLALSALAIYAADGRGIRVHERLG